MGPTARLDVAEKRKFFSFLGFGILTSNVEPVTSGSIAVPELAHSI
jgi:hypothetical protein